MIRAVLVYQSGIANVFQVDTFNMADTEDGMTQWKLSHTNA